MASTPIILDCDPGHDDALDIALALARPELELLAITTVAGKDPLDRTTRNAIRVAPLAKLELGIAFGTLLQRIPRLEPVEPPRWKPTFVLRGLETLRVRV